MSERRDFTRLKPGQRASTTIDMRPSGGALLQVGRFASRPVKGTLDHEGEWNSIELSPSDVRRLVAVLSRKSK